MKSSLARGDRRRSRVRCRLWDLSCPARKHLYRVGPSGTLLLFMGILWSWCGISVWNDFGARLNDAPHLLIPGELRWVVWLFTGGLAIYAHNKGWKLRRLATPLLFLMPTVRFCSYVTSWLLSTEILDFAVPDYILEGDPRAWGNVWLYPALDLLVLCALWAPRRWSALKVAQDEEASI